MGITIDKAIPKIQFVRNALNDDMEIAKAYDLAIDTMRKYQKIEEIYQKWIEVNDFSYNQAMSQIGVVLEDGKID